MSNTPIFDAVSDYAANDFIRCHTPGHSGNGAALGGLSDVAAFDVTEVDGMDSLYHADDIILKSEQNAAKLFGAKRTLISAGGCTLAIQTMIALVSKSGGRIAVSRNAHRSVVSTFALLDIEPVWLYPDGEVVTAQTVSNILNNNSDICAVFLTSPDYYGRLCDIESISEVCHKHSVPLLVDNAHGSHLGLLKTNLHPIHLGADLTACSAHKTLPVLTGGAFLNINNEEYIEDAKRLMSIFGSTSPSYLIMSSLDLGVDWAMKSGKSSFMELEEKVSELKPTAKEYGFLPDFKNVDPVRLTLHTAKIGLSGTGAAKQLQSFGIVPEYYDDEYVVLILTPFLKSSAFQLIDGAIKNLKPDGTLISKANIPEFFESKAIMSPRQAVFAASEIVPTSLCKGRIAADIVCPCPPGIPAVIPGEEISDRAISYLSSRNIDKIRVVK